MSYRSLAAIFFLTFAGIASGQERKDDMLILYKHLNPTTLLIRKDDKIWFKTDSLLPYKEITITRISEDTIYYLGGWVRKSQIYSLQELRDDYIKKYNLSTWRIAIPPSDVYRSGKMLHAFRSWIIHNTSSDGSYSEQAWLRSKHYHNVTVLTIKEEKERKALASQMDTVHKHYFKFNLTRLFYLQIAFGYEIRLTPKYALDFEAGYQFRNENIPRPQTDPVPLFPLEGLVVTFGPKFYYLSHKRPFVYIEPQLLFKYVYFNKNWDLENVTYGPAEFQDQQRIVFGLSFNSGTMKSFGPFFIDFTYGLGFKYALINQRLYYYASVPTTNPNGYIYYNSAHLPITRNYEKWNLLINLLLKIGVAF